MPHIIHLPEPRGRPDILWIAGEHSGDEHAGAVTRELLARHPELTICALGGQKLQEAGAQLLTDTTTSSVVGVIEVLKHYGYFKSLFRNTLEWIQTHSPKIVCFVDYPGFNLRLAKVLFDKKISCKGGGNVKLYYYISPQIWAWKANRRFKMAKYLDQLGVIFPFEKACFADTELPTTFLGHPLVSSQHAQTLFYDKDGPILLLPGSRTQAIQRIYPVLLEAFRLFSKQYPDFARPAITIYPDDSVKATLEAILAKFHQLNVTLQPSSTTIRASAALTSSGTMSLKCALAGIPHAIAYKAHPLSYLLGRFLVKIPFLGIANILLKKPAFPEFIQQNASPATLCAQLHDALSSPQRLTHTQSVAHEVKNVLSKNATTPADWLGKELVG